MDKRIEEIKKAIYDAKELAKNGVNKEKVKELVSESVRLQKRAKGEFITRETEKMIFDIQKTARTEIERKFQSWSDDVYLTSRILKCSPKELGIYKRFMDDEEIEKAMSTSAGYGGDWIPTSLSAELLDRVRLELMVGNLHRKVNMPTNPFQFPIVSSDAKGYLVSEANNVGGSSPTSPGTGGITLTAKKIGARTEFSEELNEDSIVPILPFLKENLVIALSSAIEDAIINGDDSASHMDSDVTASEDARKSWKGYRKLCQAGAKVDASSLTVEIIRTMRKKMGKYGVIPSRLALITGIAGYSSLLGLKDSSGNQAVLTVDKYGSNATVLSGELGKVDGIPVIVSEYVRENLNASGVYDGTTTNKTVIILVFTPGLIIGDRRKVTVKTDFDIVKDQQVMVATQRIAFTPTKDYTTDYLVSIGYNIGA